MFITIVNLLAFITMLVVNVLSNSGALGGSTTGEVSSEFQNLITPAGWTFSIWGVIYVLLMIFILASFFNDSAKSITHTLGHWFWISCLFNIMWLFTWHSKLIWISMIMMLGLFVSLVMMTVKLTGTFNLFSASFSVYLGWISVAMLANLTVMFVSLGMDGMGSTSQLWTSVILPLAALIIATVVFFKIDWIFGITTIFAYAGIIFRQVSASGLGAKYPATLTAAVVGIIIIGIPTTIVIINGNAFKRFSFFGG